MELRINSIVDGRYRIDRRVGAGGFGVVYEALHLSMQRTVALKVLASPGDSAEARSEAMAKLTDEAHVLTRLRHRNIVSALDFGCTSPDDGPPEPYLVLEWCEGPTLRALVRQRGALPLAEAVGLFEPILEAMAHAHAARIVHRDLKTANVMLARDADGWFPRVVDFGIARIVEGDAPAGSGQTASARGRSPYTPGYAAPEQLVGGRTGPWTDVHALGLLFVELLTGERPFDPDADALQAVDPRRPTPKAKGVDAGPFEGLIATALSLRPADRFADAGALLAAWRKARALQGAGPEAPGPVAPVAPGPSADLVPTGPRPATATDSAAASLPALPASPGPSTTGPSASPRPAPRALVAAGAAALAALAALAAGTAWRRASAPAPAALARPVSAPAPASASAPEATSFCKLTAAQLTSRLLAAGLTPSDIQEISLEPSYRSALVIFPVHMPLRWVQIHEHAYGQAGGWFAASRFVPFRDRSPNHHAVVSSQDCGVAVAGNPDVDVVELLDRITRPFSFDRRSRWPEPPPQRLEDLAPWQLPELARAAGFLVTNESASDTDARITLREAPGASLLMTTPDLTLFPDAPKKAQAFAQAGEQVVWIEGAREPVALLRRVLGGVAANVQEGSPAGGKVAGGAGASDPQPAVDDWRASSLVASIRVNGVPCSSKRRGDWWRVACRPAGGREVRMSLVEGSVDSFFQAPPEVGLVFFGRANRVVVDFASGKARVSYDSNTHAFATLPAEE